MQECGESDDEWQTTTGFARLAVCAVMASIPALVALGKVKEAQELPQGFATLGDDVDLLLAIMIWASLVFGVRSFVRLESVKIRLLGCVLLLWVVGSFAFWQYAHLSGRMYGYLDWISRSKNGLMNRHNDRRLPPR